MLAQLHNSHAHCAFAQAILKFKKKRNWDKFQNFFDCLALNHRTYDWTPNCLGRLVLKYRRGGKVRASEKNKRFTYKNLGYFLLKRNMMEMSELRRTHRISLTHASAAIATKDFLASLCFSRVCVIHKQWLHSPSSPPPSSTSSCR